MAYKCVTDGMEDLSNRLESLGKAAENAAARGLYEAAGVYADAVGKAINGIAVKPYKYAKRKEGEMREPSPEERAMLQAAGSAGIAKFEKNGLTVNTRVGFNRSGYAPAQWITKRHKGRTNYRHDGKGTVTQASSGAGGQNVKPIPVIANAINSGTAFMKKQPFFRKAISQSNGKAEEAFERRATAELDQAEGANG